MATEEQKAAIIEKCQWWHDQAENKPNDYLRYQHHQWAADYMHGIQMACILLEIEGLGADIAVWKTKCLDKMNGMQAGESK